MASTIKIKRSSVAGKMPTTSDIATGELAINTKDKKIYSSNGTAVFGFTDDYLQVANAAATYLTKNSPVITGALTANGVSGVPGYYLRTSGSGIYWSPVTGASGGSPVNATSQTFTANGSQATFTLSASIADAKNVIVTLDGLTQIPSTHYNISGTSLAFTSTPITNTIIEARDLSSMQGSGSSGATVNISDTFTAVFLLGL